MVKKYEIYITNSRYLIYVKIFEDILEDHELSNYLLADTIKHFMQNIYRRKTYDPPKYVKLEDNKVVERCLLNKKERNNLLEYEAFYPSKVVNTSNEVFTIKVLYKNGNNYQNYNNKTIMC